eukprot:COSAG01_NODE_31595_length_594_cov_54.913131_1_plen_31_part_10
MQKAYGTQRQTGTASDPLTSRESVVRYIMT